MSGKLIQESELEHYGILRKSGRYPWGSGKDPYQRGMAFYKMVEELKAKGLGNKEIAKALGLETTTQLKQTTSIARNKIRAADRAQAISLRQKGMSQTAIAKRMGINESSVRSLLDDDIAARQNVLEQVTNVLREEIDKKGYVDIGKGTENYLGISRDKLLTAVAILKTEEPAYKPYYLNQDQMGIKGNKTTVMVLGRPDTTYPELIKDPSQIKLMGWYSEDNDRPVERLQPPKAVDKSRVQIVYGDEGGAEKDGLIELRRGVPDLDMGNATYAQVRILVEGDKYIKGVAVIRDDLPPGVDVRFNTNKLSTGNDLDALKKTKEDVNNPFGSSIRRQKTYIDENGEKQLTALNIVQEEGEWREWGHNLSSQMMSKQPVDMAKRQLRFAREIQEANLEDISRLTNPTLKQELLRDFADYADAEAVDLQAMAFPRTGQHVLIPIPEMKDNEVYAPAYEQGDTVVLIRHPHGGRFEIPSLTVNNKVPAAIKVLGRQPQDAIGINARVAEQLSGADFDGDTVLVIPNRDGNVKTSRPIKALQEFNPKVQYAGFEGMKVMTNTQNEMGNISNLITDMHIMGAPMEDIVLAVKHSMVVIDAEKHELNYKQSEIDHSIARLKKEYQKAGASTVISRARNPHAVPQMKPRPAAEGGPIDRTTGELKFVPTGKGYTALKKNRTTGEMEEVFIPTTQMVKRMEVTSDARSLMSSKTGTPIERVYADHANSMKSLANKARLEMINTPNLKRSPSAAKTYAPEVESLKTQLKTAQMNAPLERQAQIIAAVKANARIEADPSMDKKQKKRVRAQELAASRELMGARKQKIDITPREWEAIQAGAIAHSPLREILNNADPDQVRAYATPRDTPTLSGMRLSKAKSMINAGYTQAEIASSLGVSVSTIAELLKNNS